MWGGARWGEEEWGGGWLHNRGRGGDEGWCAATRYNCKILTHLPPQASALMRETPSADVHHRRCALLVGASGFGGFGVTVVRKLRGLVEVEEGFCGIGGDGPQEAH